jgi:hypothetical protein
MRIRFGGAAGPIAFERMRRMHNGSWDTITVPMGLALRTTALLEPLAPPNSVVVDEKFHQFGGGLMIPLSQSDLPGIDYDRDEQKFVLRKNSLDPPYYTKLWKIDLG